MKKPPIVSGFRFSGISAGIKQTKKSDLALIYSEVPAVVSGTFTTNRVQAAPVLVSKKNIRSGLCRAVIINSGNANACTGAHGLRDAEAMVQATARFLKIPPKQVLVCSTGKIGVPLPIGKIVSKIPVMVKRLSSDGFLKCAEAILTTDNGVKIAEASVRIGRRRCRIVVQWGTLFNKLSNSLSSSLTQQVRNGGRRHPQLTSSLRHCHSIFSNQNPSKTGPNR